MTAGESMVSRPRPIWENCTAAPTAAAAATAAPTLHFHTILYALFNFWPHYSTLKYNFYDWALGLAGLRSAGGLNFEANMWASLSAEVGLITRQSFYCQEI